MGRPSTRALLFYQELLAVREALNLLPVEHREALLRIEAHLIERERTRLANAAHNGKGEARTVEDSIAFGKELMALPSEQERIKACRMVSALEVAKKPMTGRLGWWGGRID